VTELIEPDCTVGKLRALIEPERDSEKSPKSGSLGRVGVFEPVDPKVPADVARVRSLIARFVVVVEVTVEFVEVLPRIIDDVREDDVREGVVVDRDICERAREEAVGFVSESRRFDLNNPKRDESPPPTVSTCPENGTTLTTCPPLELGRGDHCFWSVSQ
jgi:hypothetical protein